MKIACLSGDFLCYNFVMDFLTDRIASEHLGKKSEGSVTYDPSLLVAVPRFDNRIRYGIEQDNLPFFGFDVWHAYEFSAMTEQGLPVTRVLKLKYSCDNEFIVESKSLKLYLNSFNMTRFGTSITDCLDICKSKIEKDLSECLKTPVYVNFLDNTVDRIEIFTNFDNIMNFVDEKSLTIENFKEAPEVLVVNSDSGFEAHYLMFDSLRSNCRVTHQPDFGDVFIYYKSHKHIDEGSLVKYLVSFRSEFHFHEECCEMIYKRLKDRLDGGDELFVCALYTRRGGIDISPVRYSENCSLNEAAYLSELSVFARFGIKQ